MNARRLAALALLLLPACDACSPKPLAPVDSGATAVLVPVEPPPPIEAWDRPWQMRRVDAIPEKAWNPRVLFDGNRATWIAHVEPDGVVIHHQVDGGEWERSRIPLIEPRFPSFAWRDDLDVLGERRHVPLLTVQTGNESSRMRVTVVEPDREGRFIARELAAVPNGWTTMSRIPLLTRYYPPTISVTEWGKARTFQSGATQNWEELPAVALPKPGSKLPISYSFPGGLDTTPDATLEQFVFTLEPDANHCSVDVRLLPHEAKRWSKPMRVFHSDACGNLRPFEYVHREQTRCLLFTDSAGRQVSGITRPAHDVKKVIGLCAAEGELDFKPAKQFGTVFVDGPSIAWLDQVDRLCVAGSQAPPLNSKVEQFPGPLESHCGHGMADAIGETTVERFCGVGVTGLPECSPTERGVPLEAEFRVGDLRLHIDPNGPYGLVATRCFDGGCELLLGQSP